MAHRLSRGPPDVARSHPLLRKIAAPYPMKRNGMPMPFRLVFALLALGVVVHGANALAGPGEWPFHGAITTWLYLGLLVWGGLICAMRGCARSFPCGFPERLTN